MSIYKKILVYKISQTIVMKTYAKLLNRVIFMDDHIPIRPDRSLLFGRQNSKWSLWAVGIHQNNSICKNIFILYYTSLGP